jgi:hypothetical protein
LADDVLDVVGPERLKDRDAVVHQRLPRPHCVTIVSGCGWPMTMVIVTAHRLTGRGSVVELLHAAIITASTKRRRVADFDRLIIFLFVDG